MESLPWMDSGGESWRSATGVQQGDPLVSMLYALLVESVMEDLHPKLAQ